MLRKKRLIKKSQESEIVAAIKEAEKNSSGEIRVHIESKCPLGDPVKRAVEVFNITEMYKTKARNGVLVYISVKSKQFAIIGDEGINKVVESGFWDDIISELAKNLEEGRMCPGICAAIKRCGIKLKEYFPYTEDDINEQPDEISYGK